LRLYYVDPSALQYRRQRQYGLRGSDQN